MLKKGECTKEDLCFSLQVSHVPASKVSHIEIVTPASSDVNMLFLWLTMFPIVFPISGKLHILFSSISFLGSIDYCSFLLSNKMRVVYVMLYG